MIMPGPDTPLIKTVDKSGFPFQLAVDRELRTLGQRHSWAVVPEVPIGDRFADIVLRRPNLLAVVECKRVDGEHWQFLVPKGSSSNRVRCRVEWHNPRAVKPPALMGSLLRLSKIFCSECTMSEGSYEASICVLPKKNAQTSLETLSRDILGTTHTLGELFGLQFDATPTYLIPVIATNAELSICEYDPASLDINTGHLGGVEFKPADFVRFRKTLVSRRSNDYVWQRGSLEDWAADRERTVFVVSPGGLDRFLSGFRAFGYAGADQHPPEFVSPPQEGTGLSDFE